MVITMQFKMQEKVQKTLDKAVSISKDSIVDEYEVFITLNSKKYKIEFDETGKFESARLL